MGKAKNLHVVPRNEGWIIRKEGSVKATSVHGTQREAVDAARAIAKKQSGELIIHGRDGRIRDRDSYGQDPYPPRDRKVLFPAKSGSVSGKAVSKAVGAVVEKSKSGSKRHRGPS